MSKGLKTSRRTSDGQFHTGVGWLRKALVTTDDSGIGEALLYDGTDATGILIFRGTGPDSSTADTFGVSTNFDFPGAGVLFETGLYLDLSGGTTAVQAY